ncbi:MAG: WYL domain-containing protein [Chlorobium phaeovibrioides]|nr:WYL domain-containing protein [Chlorobium phaeovibrioides]
MPQKRSVFERLQLIDAKLRNKSYPNCQTLSASLVMTPKTVQRDLNYMRFELSAPIKYDSRRRGFYYESDWTFFPNGYFNEQDTRSLLAAKSTLERYRGEPYYKEICGALDKVLSNLKGSHSGQHLLDVYSFARTPRGMPSRDCFENLERAIRGRLKVRFGYVSLRTGKASERLLDPYRLHLAEDGWYLIAIGEPNKGPRSFLLQNIRNLEVTREAYRVDPEFNIEGYIDQRFFVFIDAGEKRPVRIWFSARFSDYIQSRRWHPAQEIAANSDGSIILSMNVDADDIVACWVMQFGTGAEVLEPDGLRMLVVREAEAIAGLYGDGGQGAATQQRGVVPAEDSSKAVLDGDDMQRLKAQGAASELF